MDVRSDSAFRRIHTDAKTNAMGTIKGSMNIPLISIQNNTASLPGKEREIIVTDMFGGDAAKAAVLLTQNDYKNVSVLVEGVERILATDVKNIRCPDLNESRAAFKTFNATEFSRYIKSNPDIVLLDIRSDSEFNNIHKDYWRNIGNLKNAFHIPVENLAAAVGNLDKNREFVVYGLGGGPEVFKAAQILADKGFKKLTLLHGGIFNVRWASGNVKGQEHLRELVENVPEVNQ